MCASLTSHLDFGNILQVQYVDTERSAIDEMIFISELLAENDWSVRQWFL